MSTLLLAAILVTAPIPKESPAIEASTKKIKELQKERIAILKDAADTSFKLAKNARIEICDAMEDRMTLLKAELEVAEKELDRITLYMKALDDLKAYEELAKARFDAGRATELPLFKVKAKRLETQIALEQAKIKEAREK